LFVALAAQRHHLRHSSRYGGWSGQPAAAGALTAHGPTRAIGRAGGDVDVSRTVVLAGDAARIWTCAGWRPVVKNHC
jgi:hypothetical protein